jgi:hypothetical protein
MEDERSLSIHAMSLAACRPADVYRRPRICYRHWRGLRSVFLFFRLSSQFMRPHREHAKPIVWMVHAKALCRLAEGPRC